MLGAPGEPDRFTSPTSIESSTPGSNSATTLERPRPSPNASFLYGNLFYTSFADQVFAKTQGTKVKARTIFSAGGIGLDYTRYSHRYLYGWTANLLSGAVDLERVGSNPYPQKVFLGLQTGPEVGYRVNPDLDLSFGLGLLYREIKDVGSSLAVANQFNIKFRLTPKLTYFQNFGNYGSAKAYSYSIGLRWLL